MHHNRIRQAALAGRTAFGIYVKLPAPGVVELAARTGLDFVRMDMFHGAVSSETLDVLIGAAYANGLTPTVRVENDPEAVRVVVERGAMGVTIPGVESPEQAARAVAASRYPRLATTSPFGGTDLPDNLGLSADVLVSVQIESKRGLEALGEIVCVEGLDMLQCGRSDLAVSLGVAGQTLHPRVLAAEERIAEAAWAAGKWLSLHFPPGAESIEQARAWVRRGIQCVTIGGDTQILVAAMNDRLKSMRE